MKKNLITAFALHLEYLLNLHTHIENINYNVELIYSILNQDLQSYVTIRQNVMAISIF